MSNWTYITGVLETRPLGETQAEKTYVLETTLNHLPVIHGSERPMNIYIQKRAGHNVSRSHDELGNFNTEQMEWYDTDKIQDTYIITLDGAFRDNVIEETEKNFRTWMETFAERCLIDSVLVKITGYDKEIIINEDPSELYKYPSWSRASSEENWVEKNTCYNMGK